MLPTFDEELAGPPPLDPAEPWPPTHWLGVAPDVGAPVDLGPPPAPVEPPPAPDDPFLAAMAGDLGVGELEAPAVAPPPGLVAAPQPDLQTSWGAAPVPQPEASLGAADPLEAPYELDPLGDEDLLGQLAQKHENDRQADLAPEDLAVDAALRDQERQTFLQDRTIEEFDRNQQQAIANHADWQKANAEAQRESAELRANAKALSERGVDRGNWWASRDTGQRIAAFATAIISGLLEPQGKNSAIDLIRSEIDKDVDEQIANLDHQRAVLGQRQGMVSELFAQNGDAYRAAETVRLAAYAGVDAKLAAEAGRFDPRGTTAQRINEARMGIRQAQAAALAKADADGFERRLKLAKEYREQAEFERKMRPSGPKLPSIQDQIAAYKAGATIGPGGVLTFAAPQSGVSKDPEEIKKEADARKAVADADRAELEGSPDERARKLGVGGIVRTDGAPVIFRNETVADEFATKVSAAQTFSTLIDEIDDLREDVGGEWFKTERARQIQSKYAGLIDQWRAQAKAGTLDDGAVEQVGRFLGTKNPTEMRNIMPGLNAARDTVVTDVNSKLMVADPKAKPWRPTKTERAKARERSKEENATILTQGIPPHARADEVSKGKAVEAKKQASAVLLKRQQPSADELHGWAKAIDKQVASGELTKDEAIAIVSPMAIRIAEKEREKIATTSVEELEKLQKDPGYVQRATMLHLIERGQARPEEIYRIAVGGS